MPEFFGNRYTNIGGELNPVFIRDESSSNISSSLSSSGNEFASIWRKSDDFGVLADPGAILSFNHPLGDNIHLSRVVLQNGIIIGGLRYSTNYSISPSARNSKTISFHLPNITSINWYKTDNLTGTLESMSNYLYETDWRLCIENAFGSDFDGAGLNHIDENAFAFTTSLSFVNGQSGTWVVPPDVVSATVSLIGGGGGGGAYMSGSGPSWYLSPQDSWPGGASTFSGNGVDMIANGGSPGYTGGAGGTASGGDINNTGESGTAGNSWNYFAWSSGKSAVRYIYYPARNSTSQVDTNGLLPSQKLIATYTKSGSHGDPQVITTVSQPSAGYGIGGEGRISPWHLYSSLKNYQSWQYIGGAGGFTTKTFNVQEGQVYEFTSGVRGTGSGLVNAYSAGPGIVHITWETSNQN